MSKDKINQNALTFDDLIEKKKPLQALDFSDIEIRAQQEPGFLDKVSGIYDKRVDKSGDIIKLMATGQQTVPESLLQGMGNALMGGAEVIGQGVSSLAQTGFESLPDSTQIYLKEKGSDIAEAFGETDVAKVLADIAESGVEKYASLKEENPRLFRNIEGVASIMTATPAVKGGAKLLPEAKGANIPHLTPLSGDLTFEDISSKNFKLSNSPDPTASGINKAVSLVRSKMQKDFPDDWERVFELWSQGNEPLVKAYGKNITNLAKGSAQFPQGEARLADYFGGQVADMPDRVGKAISENVNDNLSFNSAIRSIVDKGRAKAKPLYEEAEKFSVLNDEELTSILKAPFMKKALKDSVEIQEIENASLGLKPNPNLLSSIEDALNQEQIPMRVLDQTKRGIDSLIEKETDAISGLSNKGRALVDLRKSLLSKLDKANPVYAKARKEAGDYLSLQEAGNKGRDFMKVDVEDLSEDWFRMSKPEKEAYKLGVSKKLRDLMESRTGSDRNPYNTLFKGKAQQKKLATILSPAEYNKLDKALQAEDRLFKLRNEVMGNSATVSKMQAVKDIENIGGDIVESIATGSPRASVLGAIQKSLSSRIQGLSDKNANAVASILLETDPVKKMEILDKVMKKHGTGSKVANLVKSLYTGLSQYSGRIRKKMGKDEAVGLSYFATTADNNDE